VVTSLGEDRLAELRSAKLRALAPALGLELRVVTGYPNGAAGHDGSGRGAVLLDAAGPRSLGPAVMWAVKAGVTELVVVAGTVAAPSATNVGWELDEVAGRLARQAGWHRTPSVSVVTLAERTPQPVEAAPVPDPTKPPSADAWDRATVLGDAGLDVLVEHGVIWGEVLGLGLACVATGPDGAARLELGVGRFDREIGLMLHGDRPDVAAIATAAELVRRHRRPGAPVHPIRDLVPERWVRHTLLAQPGLVGAVELRPVDSTLRPQSMRERQPVAAFGHDESGHPMLVVASAGVDLDLVPHAADTCSAWHPEARLVLVVPAALPAAALAVAATLTCAAEVVVVAPPWN